MAGRAVNRTGAQRTFEHIGSYMHAGDFASAYDVGIGIAMTVKTPSHRQWFLLRYNALPFNLTVTGSTINTGVDMTTVIEKRVIGEAVYSNPFYGHSVLVARSHEFKFRTLTLYSGMAVHAGTGRRYGGMR